VSAGGFEIEEVVSVEAELSDLADLSYSKPKIEGEIKKCAGYLYLTPLYAMVNSL
jgi:hypothetical protein